MKTRITELFSIQYPIFCPGMTYVANAKLVAAVSEAGGLGIMAVGHLSPEETRLAIQEVRSYTQKPFGIGAALLMPGSEKNVQVAIEEKVPVINFSLGKGDWICEQVHAYGGKVIATVVSEKHALAAERYGVDALLVTGHEAAAHGGAVTSLVLIPAIRKVTSLPIIATGGFGTGQGLAAALCLGADAIAMGTRFAASQESPVHAQTKVLITQKAVQETVYSSNFDTMPCRVMETPHAKKRLAKKLTLPKVLWRAIQAARENGMSYIAIVREIFKKGIVDAITLMYFGSATAEIKKAIIDGNHQDGIQLIGQVQGLVDDVPTVKEIIQRVMLQTHEASHGLQAIISAHHKAA